MMRKIGAKGETMNKPSHFIDLSLLKTHAAFRAVFIARFISIVALGMLAVAVPVQIQQMTHSRCWWASPSHCPLPACLLAC